MVHISGFKTDFPVKCGEYAPVTSQLVIHRLLCSLVHSHSITHLNYWNMCKLDYAIILAATLLAPTRYQTISKHHATFNVTIITCIDNIVKYWGNWEIPRQNSKYRSNWCTDSFVDRTSAAILLTILGQPGKSGWYFEDDFKSIFSIETLCILIHSLVESVPSVSCCNQQTKGKVLAPSVQQVITCLFIHICLPMP